MEKQKRLHGEEGGSQLWTFLNTPTHNYVWRRAGATGPTIEALNARLAARQEQPSQHGNNTYHQGVNDSTDAGFLFLLANNQYQEVITADLVESRKTALVKLMNSLLPGEKYALYRKMGLAFAGTPKNKLFEFCNFGVEAGEKTPLIVLMEKDFNRLAKIATNPESSFLLTISVETFLLKFL